MSIHFEIRNGVLVKYHGRGTHVLIPNSVTKIGDMAFLSCTSLTSVVIPDSVTEIGSEAFLGCTSLTSVIIPNSVTEIGGGVFWRCTSLTSVVIPNRVTLISDTVFKYCKRLTVFCPRFSNAWFYCKKNRIPVKSIKHAKIQQHASGSAQKP